MSVFVYGTLLADDTVKFALGKTLPSKKATLKGYKRVSLKNRAYPGLVKGQEQDQVHGRVLLELDDKELVSLDGFEGEEYDRCRETVIDEDGREVEVYVYVWKTSYQDQVLDQDWNFEAWTASITQPDGTLDISSLF